MIPAVAKAHAIERDDLRGGGNPIFVARRSLADAQVPCAAPVTHSHAALVFYTAGRSRLQLSEPWRLEAGDVMLVPAGQPHRTLELDRAEWWGLGVCVPCFAASDTGALLEPFERVREGASPIVRMPSERHAFLETLFRELGDATDPRRSTAPGIVQRSLLSLVLHEVHRAAQWDVHASKPAGVVIDALRFIERNCLRRLTLDDVAAAVGRSPAYVTTALSRATGRSAVEWIVAGRMAEARRTLLYSDERIEAISERVGYADPTHFIRMFRREHGATPAAWRAARRRPGAAP